MKQKSDYFSFGHEKAFSLQILPKFLLKTAGSDHLFFFIL
jgi:hypothetical protein